jgi:hypothetical protein
LVLRVSLLLSLPALLFPVITPRGDDGQAGVINVRDTVEG